jgi:hypothetical protein
LPQECDLKIYRKWANSCSYFLAGILLLILLLPAMDLFARQSGAGPQDGTASITGKVTVAAGEGSISKLAGITVKISGPAPVSNMQTAVTDEEGQFTFAHLAPGVYSLGAELDGFKQWTAKVTLGANQSLVQDATLQISGMAQEVHVQGEATDVATQSVSATATVTQHELINLPLPTAKFTEALSLSPGVIRTQEGKLNFKGQTESQGMLIVDSAENVDPVSGSFGIPIPVDVIQSLTVYETPDSSEFGGFSGGLTKIELKPPPGNWNYQLLDFIPSFRGKNGSIVGLANLTPRLDFGGPIIKDKLNFSQEFTYEFRRTPVRGLSWPFNETTTRAFTSFSQLQAILSTRHVLNININVFPASIHDANIDSLVPQSASANYYRAGASAGVSDSYQFGSGALLNTIVRYTRFDSSSHGQGSATMEISPEGWGGNFFNAWSRKSNQMEALPTYQLASKTWHGSHELRMGEDLLYRTYGGTNVSHPVEVRREDGSLAERIDFQGSGQLSSSSLEVSEFAEDQWTLTSRLSVNYGARVTSQSNGREFAFAPRAGLAYALANGKTVIRASADEIYGHVPLLAADFARNQSRVISLFDPSGVQIGQPTILRNVYLPGPGDENLNPAGYPGTSPRTFTWNLELQSEVRKNLNIRVGYLDSHTANLFIVDPVVAVTGNESMLTLRNTGASQYKQADVTARYRPSERTEVNVSYIWSRARGDLNVLSDTFVLFQAPVIRPNVSGIFSSDVPHRVIAWGSVHLPWKTVISPVADIHSGFPYSNLDVLQNYVGVPNGQRFPVYFSLDFRIYREFAIHIPYMDHGKKRTLRLGFYSLNATNHLNPHDIYSNVTSPIFGTLAGFQRRVNGLVLDVGK